MRPLRLISARGGRPTTRSVPERRQMVTQRRSRTELADEMVYNLAQVAVRGIRHHQLPVVARTLAERRVDRCQFATAFQLDRDVADPLEGFQKMLAHGH